METSTHRTRAIFFDFGGVLTSSVLDAFGDLGQDLFGDKKKPLHILATDAAASSLLVEHEEGRLGSDEFDSAFGAVLVGHGASLPAEGFISNLQSRLTRDEAMVRTVADLRERGFKVGLISNSLGANCYAGFDLDAMFDAVAISKDEGVRKPSRRLFSIACDRLGVDPNDAVMVDDLEQNVVAARRFGMVGIRHRHAENTRLELSGELELEFGSI